MLSVLECNQIQKQTLEWVTEPFIPKGEMSIFTGLPGTYKSTLAANFMADVSNDVSVAGASNKCLYINNEDSPSVIKERLQAAKANTDNCLVFTKTDELTCLNWGDYISELEKEISAKGVGFIIIDPIYQCLPSDVSSHGGKNAGQFMSALVSLIREYGCTMMFITHLNKIAGSMGRDNEIELDSMKGGRVFSGTARSVFISEQDGMKKGMYRLRLLKSNIAPHDGRFPFSYEKARNTIIWHPPYKDGDRPKEKEWIKDYILRLLDGRSLTGSNLEAKRKEHNFGDTTWRDARRELRDSGVIEYDTDTKYWSKV